MSDSVPRQGDAGVLLNPTIGEAASALSTQSPLGTNFTQLRDWSRAWPFVDAFKMSRAWTSGSDAEFDDGQALDLDSNGWVRSLEDGQIARTLVFTGLNDLYPSGRYVLLYEGEGTIVYKGAATRDDAASSPGRDVLDVNASLGTLQIDIVASTPSNYLRNLHLIMPGGVCDQQPLRWCDGSAPCGQGSCTPFEDNYETQIFHPVFLARIASYRVLRFMDWMDTNNSTQQDWADRPQVTDARWTTHGVPIEIMVELANRLGADPWFNVPHLATDDYVMQMATAVAGALASDRNAMAETSNEPWNGAFDQADYFRSRGLELGLSDNPFHAQILFYSQRSVEVMQIFEAAFGGTENLVRVIGSQAANAWVSDQMLTFNGGAAHIDALAIAPYFGGYLGNPQEQAHVASMSLQDLMTELADVALPQAANWVANTAAVAQGHGVRLIAYEAGQHLAGHGGVQDNEAVNALFDAANRSPSMRELYLQYLNDWRNAGGELVVHYADCSGYTKWGRWGAFLSTLPARR